MKILYLNVSADVGSTGRICNDLASKVVNNGADACIAYGREISNISPKIKKYKIGNRLEIMFHAFISRVFDCTGSGSYFATKKFVSFIKQYNPDIIHIHNVHGYYLNIKLLFSYLKDTDIKIVWTLHDCWTFTGHCAYFDFIDCKKWTSHCCNCELKHEYPKSIFLDNSSHNFDKKRKLFTSLKSLIFVTPSLWLKNLVSNSFLSKYECYNIYNGIDTKIFKRISNPTFKNKYNIRDRKIILGVAFPWSERKGLKDFIKLSRMISNEYIIVLVGLPSETINNLPSNIIGITRTKNVHELIDIYSSAYVLFNPTYEDNYPTVNLEAQCCKLPVITYNTGGSVESVPKKQVIDKGDLNAFVNLLNNSNLEVLNSDFSCDRMAQEYLYLYKKIKDGTL